MHDPSAPLQKALVARLKAAALLVSARVYDRVDPSAIFPYIQIGATQVVPDEAGCIDLAECNVTIHAWSRAVGAVEARRVSDGIAAALTEWEPDLSADGFVCAELRVTSIQVMADPDGVTTHGVVQIEAQTERL